MTIITKSIGTNGRDYSTIALWEADLDGAAGGEGNDAVGECHDDSTFDDGVTFDDGTPVSVRLTVHPDCRHDGTAAGGGVVVDYAGTIFVFDAPTNVTLEWLRITGFTTTLSNVYAVNAKYQANGVFQVKNCVIHDGGNYGVRLYGDNLRQAYNNIIYGITKPGFYGSYAMFIDWSGLKNAYNNTIYNSRDTGLRCDSIDHRLINNIAVGCGDVDFNAATTHGQSDYNADSDGTAPNGHSLTTTPGNLFVSTVQGSEDLHLKAGADAIDAGDDLDDWIAIDIDGDDRRGLTWDIGADQHPVTPTGNPWWYYQMIAG